MTADELRRRLEEAGPEALASLLVEIAEENGIVRERIESLALRGDLPAQLAALERRLKRFRNGRSFISYGESGDFARGLEVWLDEVESSVIAADPQSAWKLLDRFLRTDEKILSRADDSNGSIGDAYRRACTLWHRAAAAFPAEPDRADHVYELHAGNDYGTRDAILDQAAISLSEIELRRLARTFEAEAKVSGAEGEDYRPLAAAAAMGQIACALEDAALFERSVHIRSPQPNSLQAERIAERYLQFGPVAKAVEWLRQTTDGSDAGVGRLDLLADAYEKLDDAAGLLDARRRLFERSFSADRFSQYMALLPSDARDAVRRDALERAARCNGAPVAAAQFLLEIGEAEEASRLVLRLRGHLPDEFYTHVLTLAQRFEKEGCALPAVACYRALTEEILGAARTRAYRHAKRYVDRLTALHDAVPDYGELPDYDDYLAGLRKRHGRKHSFWRLLSDLP